MAKAEEYGYSPTRALAIVKAESNFKPDVKNASSTASGLFQFLNGTFEHYCVTDFGFATSTSQKNDPDIQIECAMKMLAEGGEGHWNASRHVWGTIK